MKVVHAVVVTPYRCGLYETTRELVHGLRQLGVDSRMWDPAPKMQLDGPEDRGAPTADTEWARHADIIVNHSGYDGTELSSLGKPEILVCHGRPRSSFLSEKGGSTPIYSWQRNRNSFDPLKAVVTFWPQHKPYHEFIFPDKPIHVVPVSVDLDAWKFDGPKGYKFQGHKGETNIVISDPIRDDVDLFYPLHAAGLFARRHPGVKIHVYGRRGKSPGTDTLIRRIQDDGNFGELGGWVRGLDNVYRAASMLITANDIDTRTVREASACGCPVVRISSLSDGWEVPILKAAKTGPEDRYIIRKHAEINFNPVNTATAFKKVLDCL